MRNLSNAIYSYRSSNHHGPVCQASDHQKPVCSYELSVGCIAFACKQQVCVFSLGGGVGWPTAHPEVYTIQLSVL